MRKHASAALWTLLAGAWPATAFAKDSPPWQDGSIALPVFLVGAALVALVGSVFTQALRTFGLLLWIVVVTIVGCYAVFAEAEAFQVIWKTAGYLAGAGVFLYAAQRSLQKLDTGERQY